MKKRAKRPPKPRGAPTQELVKELLHYDPETGEFRWIVSAGRRRAGAAAGCVRGPKGRQYLSIDLPTGREYAHRLAWLYVHGWLPPAELDHKDTDRLNNRIGNLRPATHSENGRNQNRKKVNTSGFKGVVWHREGRKWSARVTIDMKMKYLGLFATKEEAARAYDAAARVHYGEFARLNFPNDPPAKEAGRGNV